MALFDGVALLVLRTFGRHRGGGYQYWVAWTAVTDLSATSSLVDDIILYGDGDGDETIPAWIETVRMIKTRTTSSARIPVKRLETWPRVPSDLELRCAIVVGLAYQQEMMLVLPGI